MINYIMLKSEIKFWLLGNVTVPVWVRISVYAYIIFIFKNVSQIQRNNLNYNPFRLVYALTMYDSIHNYVHHTVFVAVSATCLENAYT